jgi:DNA-binding LacI/PurR family transcriptional regulator
MEGVDLQRIMKSLLTGGVTEIAKRAGVSTTTVSHTFQGRTNNIKVLKVIAEVAKEHKAQAQAAYQAINEVLNN